MEFLNSDTHRAGNILTPWEGHQEGASIGRWICQLEKDSSMRPEWATERLIKARAGSSRAKSFKQMP